eukprot:3369621-Prorocentrum_lima.AAC.1
MLLVIQKTCPGSCGSVELAGTDAGLPKFATSIAKPSCTPSTMALAATCRLRIACQWEPPG